MMNNATVFTGKYLNNNNRAWEMLQVLVQNASFGIGIKWANLYIAVFTFEQRMV